MYCRIDKCTTVKYKVLEDNKTPINTITQETVAVKQLTTYRKLLNKAFVEGRLDVLTAQQLAYQV